MTDEEFYERHIAISESWRQATPEELAAYNRGSMQATPEQMAELNALMESQLQQDPYLVKLEEMEQRHKMETENRFTKWCRGARKWDA